MRHKPSRVTTCLLFTQTSQRVSKANCNKLAEIQAVFL